MRGLSLSIALLTVRQESKQLGECLGKGKARASSFQEGRLPRTWPE